jgi:hypothetical protein
MLKAVPRTRKKGSGATIKMCSRRLADAASNAGSDRARELRLRSVIGCPTPRLLDNNLFNRPPALAAANCSRSWQPPAHFELRILPVRDLAVKARLSTLIPE